MLSKTSKRKEENDETFRINFAFYIIQKNWICEKTIFFIIFNHNSLFKVDQGFEIENQDARVLYL